MRHFEAFFLCMSFDKVDQTLIGALLRSFIRRTKQPSYSSPWHTDDEQKKEKNKENRKTQG